MDSRGCFAFAALMLLRYVNQLIPQAAPAHASVWMQLTGHFDVFRHC